MSSTEPVAQPELPPRSLHLGVIIWSDDPEQEPTVIADRNPVTLARSMALAIHEMISIEDLYAGATDFLNEQPPPQDWEWPEDVDRWLDDLREATPYPAYSFHQIPITGGADGTNHTAVSRLLVQALQDRERSLTADPEAAASEVPDVSREAPGSSMGR